MWLPPLLQALKLKEMEIIISDAGDEQDGMHITLMLK